MSALGAQQQEAARTEAELVEAARAGDDRAFGELYERYGRRVFGYVLYMVRDHGRAEDLAQDIFVSAFRRIRSSDRAISFKPWIFEIAKNACIDEFRRVQRSREVPMEHGSDEHLGSAAPSPDIHFERGQQLAALDGAFRGLSERQHNVLVLRELEGLSYAEIASRTGMTLHMVESTLLRARRRLSQEYDDIASGRTCEQVHLVVDAGGQAAVNALGLRERRRFVRHIAQCQPCGRYARMAGIAEPEKRIPAAVKKLAGLLPLPLTRWPSGRGGRAGGGFLRSARRAAQLAHPGASVTASPAVVAGVAAAIVIAGGGAAVDVLWHEGAGHATPTAVTARPTAVTRSLAAPARRVSVRATGTTASHAAAADRSNSARSAQSATRQTKSSSTRQASSPNSSGGVSQPDAPNSQSPQSPQSPSPPSVPKLPIRLPQLPQLPQQATHALHKLTNPLKKLVNKLAPDLPSSLQQLTQAAGALPSLDP